LLVSVTVRKNTLGVRLGGMGEEESGEGQQCCRQSLDVFSYIAWRCIHNTHINKNKSRLYRNTVDKKEDEEKRIIKDKTRT
jgi:hypothetical protein